MTSNGERQAKYRRRRAGLTTTRLDIGGTELARRMRLAALDTTWKQHAECVGSDPDLFFPERGEDASQAKAICAVCPVRAACLNHALVAVERHGIWGGTSERERRRMRRRREAS